MPYLPRAIVGGIPHHPHFWISISLFKLRILEQKTVGLNLTKQPGGVDANVTQDDQSITNTPEDDKNLMSTLQISCKDMLLHHRSNYHPATINRASMHIEQFVITQNFRNPLSRVSSHKSQSWSLYSKHPRYSSPSRSAG